MIFAQFDVFNREARAQTQQVSPCEQFYDKALELAEESIQPLPTGQTIDFDPRVAKATSSIAYSNIYQNCMKYQR